MKKSVKIAIIAGIFVTVIIGGLALFVHFKLSEIEKNETGQESAEQIAKEVQEVLSGKESHSEEGEDSNSALTFSSLVTKDTPLKGDPLAPITLIEFGDFQCPNCGRFARETGPQIEASYVESGQVSMAFKHFTVVGPDSKIAAMASQCANEQEMFWEFHDALYNNQGPENSGWVKKDNLKKIASDIGLDKQSFDSCLDSNKYQSLVENDLNLAKQIDFTGTPSFLILKNDGSKPQALTGAYPYATFQKIFDESLNLK